ncbi:hypothetical protein LPB248_08595 [Flavobacterium sp. LPB0248]|uniref:hypothetical protein n=1 Tax=Flavobacterium sp. LPB0248 TaxID=2614441 RepID=UPI0015A5B4B5|nr:hypothetical protein [Flavobacterium sp. LPB0248]QLC66337.1 hypothetical protein LPB248_08595 [Flavobacterium sp. LPB0248]
MVTLFLITSKVNSQVITPMTLPFEKICADSNYNEFNVTFEIQGFSNSASYVVELSDSADFSNPVTTTILSTTDLAVNRKTIKFAIPQDLVGSEKYSLRIKEKVSGIASPLFPSYVGSKIFSVYYKIHNNQFTINNLKPTADYCIGGSYVLSIDAATESNNSPLKYPSLRYNWYKNNGLLLPETLVASDTKGTYTVTEPGTYYAKTNYGTCTSNSYSNQVTITESTGDSNVAIVSSLGNPFCLTDGETTLSVAAGTNYKWFRDNVLIEGAINQTYSTKIPGVYSVVVGIGSCQSTGSINLQSNDFTAVLDIPKENTIDTQNDQTLEANITTNAEAPNYKWYLGGVLIPDAVSNTYLIKTAGTYKAVVTQTVNCIATKELNFQVSDLGLKDIPNVISLSSAINSWDIPVVYKNAATNVTIISSQGEVIFNGVNYTPSKWEIKDFKSVNPVYYYIITTRDKQEKKGSITIIK